MLPLIRVKEQVFQAFDVGAFHYLLKPVEKEKLLSVMERAFAEVEKAGARCHETTAFCHERFADLLADRFSVMLH